MVDDDVYEWARRHIWKLTNGYPSRRDPVVGLSYLHRELMDYPVGHVHHEDLNPLNCQRENLRVMPVGAHLSLHGLRNAAQVRERIGRAPGRSRSGYKGVCWHIRRRRWVAQFVIAGKNVTLGGYDDADQAALVYDAAVLAYRGTGYTNLIP